MSKNLKSTNIFAIIRNKSELLHEQERVTSLTTLSGPEPIPETSEYDFINANYYDLAKLTLDTFPDDSPINNEYILIIDERSLKDRTCVLLQIPAQIETEFNSETKMTDITKKERKFNRREEYVLHPNGWIDRETGEDTGTEELKAVRVRFEDANQAYTLKAREESVGKLARFTYQTNGVYTNGPSYQYPDQRLHTQSTGSLPPRKEAGSHTP